MRVRRLVCLLSVGLALAAGVPTDSHADDFYEGKVVTILVGFGPGGGYDLYARTLARYLSEYIPGKPTIVVRNQPGAGSATALQAVNSTLPKDGTILVTFESMLAAQSVVQPAAVNVDFRNYAFVGSATPNFYTC